MSDPPSRVRAHQIQISQLHKTRATSEPAQYPGRFNHLDSPGSGTSADPNVLRRRIAKLGHERVELARHLASGRIEADTYDEALAANHADEAEAAALLAHIEQRHHHQHAIRTAPDRITALIQQAHATLANPTPELMAALYDLLQLKLTRSEDGTTLYGTGIIPIPADDGHEPLANTLGRGDDGLRPETMVEP